jgi:hypothetical protein
MHIRYPNRSEIYVVTTANKHIELCCLYPSGSLYLLIFDLDTMDVHILLETLETGLEFAILHTTVIQLTIEVFSLLLENLEITLYELKLCLQFLHIT